MTPAENDPPIEVNISTSEWLAQLAHAWDKGWEACSNYVQDGDSDPAFWNVWHDNPYRVTPDDKDSA